MIIKRSIIGFWPRSGEHNQSLGGRVGPAGGAEGLDLAARACYSGPLDVKMADAGAGITRSLGTALSSRGRFGSRWETVGWPWGDRAGEEG